MVGFTVLFFTKKISVHNANNILHSHYADLSLRNYKLVIVRNSRDAFIRDAFIIKAANICRLPIWNIN